ncbi:MAG: phage head closure protein [Candidatus Marinimicrobia bacterium]|nr:phage head closure protein [Candidatus Neomarinimicrobiota bacterium]
MQAGQLDRRIDIQTVTGSVDSLGTPKRTYANLSASVPAQVMPASSSESYRNNQDVGSDDLVITIRHRTDFDRKARIVYDGNNYDIMGIQEIGRREGLELLVRVVT